MKALTVKVKPLSVSVSLFDQVLLGCVGGHESDSDQSQHVHSGSCTSRTYLKGRVNTSDSTTTGCRR